MRILILHSRYRSGAVSGENRVVDDEVRLLRDAGHEIDLYDPAVETAQMVDLARSAASTVWSRRATRQVTLRITRDRPDIVHLHNLFPALSPAVLRAVPDGVPCVMTLHNYRQLCLPGTFLREGRVCEDCFGRSLWPGVVHGCYQGSVVASSVLAGSLTLHRVIGSFRRVDLFVAISAFVRDKHIEAGFPEDRFFVKPHFAWPARPRQGPGDSFLYLGRLSPEKGPATLLEAFKGLKARLLIVGSGPDDAALRRRAPSNVEFAGGVDPDVVPGLLEGTRALLVPSLSHEGAGKVVLEAYASGVPVIASRAGGLPEVMQHGVTGLLVPPGDEGAWARAVARLIDDDRSMRMGKAAWRVWRESYGPRNGLAGLEHTYERAVERVGTQARAPRNDG